MDDYVAAILADAPPLDDEKRAKITALFASVQPVNNTAATAA